MRSRIWRDVTVKGSDRSIAHLELGDGGEKEGPHAPSKRWASRRRIQDDATKKDVAAIKTKHR